LLNIDGLVTTIMRYAPQEVSARLRVPLGCDAVDQHCYDAIKHDSDGSGRGRVVTLVTERGMVETTTL